MRLLRPSLLILLCSPCAAPVRALDLAVPGTFATLQEQAVPHQEQDGIRAGPVDVRAAAAISFGYDSNVAAVAEPLDAEGVANGYLLLRADNRAARRDFNARAFIAAHRYQDSTELNATEFGAASDLDMQLSPRDTLELTLNAQRRFERRTEIETPTSIAVSLYDDLRFSARQLHVFNRLSLRASAEGQRLQYAHASQQYRDQTLYRGELRAAYELGSNVSWFGSAYFDRDEFDSPSPQVASADTTGALLGVVLQVHDILDFELGAGYFERRFADDGGTLDGLALRGGLRWRPTRLMQLRAELTRTDEPTHVPGAFGKIRNELLVRLFHEYSRTMTLFAGGRVVFDEFVAIERDDTLYLTELGANWQVGRHSILSFTYDYGSRSADVVDRGFVRHVAHLWFMGRL